MSTTSISSRYSRITVASHSRLLSIGNHGHSHSHSHSHGHSQVLRSSRVPNPVLDWAASNENPNSPRLVKQPRTTAIVTRRRPRPRSNTHDHHPSLPPLVELSTSIPPSHRWIARSRKQKPTARSRRPTRVPCAKRSESTFPGAGSATIRFARASAGSGRMQEGTAPNTSAAYGKRENC